MATPKLITGLLKGPDDVGRAGNLFITLSQAATIPGTQETVPSSLTFAIPSTGIWPAVNLYANNDLTPSGTYYRVMEVSNDGASYSRTIVVPQGAGPYVVTSIETAPPTLGASPSRVSTLTVDGAATFTAGPVTLGALGAGILHSSVAGLVSSSLIVDADVSAVGVGKLTGTTLPASVASSSLTSVGVLASPHMTSPVVDSGGLTVTAGGLTVTAGGLTVGSMSVDSIGSILTIPSSGALRTTGTSLYIDVSGTGGTLTFRGAGFATAATLSAAGGLTVANGLTVSAGGAAITGLAQMATGLSVADSDAIPHALLSTSAAQFEIAARSMVAIGDIGAGYGDPHITWYRTTAGSTTGSAFRQLWSASVGPFKWQAGTPGSAYGTETYTDLMSLTTAGALTVANGLTVTAGGLAVSAGGAAITGDVTQTRGTGFWGHAAVGSQPAAPVTLADVIAIIRGCGLSA